MWWKACVAGHRIRVIDIMIRHERFGESADEIVAQFPGITHSDVYAALAYYYDNREEIDEEIQQESKIVELYQTSYPSSLLTLI